MNSIIENEFVLGVIHSKFRTSQNVITGYSRVGVGRACKIQIPIGEEHIFLTREIAWWQLCR